MNHLIDEQNNNDNEHINTIFRKMLRFKRLPLRFKIHTEEDESMSGIPCLLGWLRGLLVPDGQHKNDTNRGKDVQ